MDASPSAAGALGRPSSVSRAGVRVDRGRRRRAGGRRGRVGGPGACLFSPPSFFFLFFFYPRMQISGAGSGRAREGGVWDKKGGEVAAWRLAVGRGGEGSLLMTH